jgi:hypothetical protein
VGHRGGTPARKDHHDRDTHHHRDPELLARVVRRRRLHWRRLAVHQPGAAVTKDLDGEEAEGFFDEQYTRPEILVFEDGSGAAVDYVDYVTHIERVGVVA